MKLQFRILWIDDDRSNDDTKIKLEREKTTILQYLEADYFEGTIESNTWTLDTSQPFPYDSEHYDLFIVDFNIWDKNGFQYIKWIRESAKYTDIIFYSKNSIAQEILTYLNGWNDFLEWVFLATRDELAMKFHDLLDIIDRKVNNLYSMRGLVLAETAEIDYILCEIITKLCTKHHITLQGFQLRKWGIQTKQFDYTTCVTFQGNDPDKFTAWLSKKTSNYKKIEWLTNPNNPNNLIQDIASIQTDLNDYRLFYEKKRNPLAHKKTTIQNNSLTAGNVPYTIQKLKNIRWKLLKWKKCFTQFRDSI